MKHVYTHDNTMIVNSAKNILALNGIESVVKNDAISHIHARHGINNTFCELWILNDQDFDKAVSIIETEVKYPEVKEPWTCAKCKEENEGSFDLCWNCQTEKSQEST
ncbi:MAG: DUF2007 domain-containing protein [Pseudomonadales bacterium]|nr:DUF2007 domain-containing protein [Pseudomonadales bacterium]